MDGEGGGTRKKRGAESETTTTTRTAKRTTRYKGIRMRKWGKWVAEIREPNKRSRIWLGSYSTPVAAARAYDTALFYLRGPSARLNFPDLLAGEPPPAAAAAGDMSPASIRKKAIEVGARVDALQATAARGGASEEFAARVDLNEMPDPENPGCNCDRDEKL